MSRSAGQFVMKFILIASRVLVMQHAVFQKIKHLFLNGCHFFDFSNIIIFTCI